MKNTIVDDHTPDAIREKGKAALSSVLAAILLTTMKIVVGLLTGSLGILSEAAHSGLDLVAAAVTFFAVRLSSRPPDRRHTYGYGKVENLSALFETFLLLLTCVWIIYEAIQRLFFKSVQVEASIWAFIVMATSIVIDFSRSRILAKAAKKYSSQALEADALHFSTDIWSSSVVIAGLALVSLSNWLKLEWLAKADAVAAMGVAGIVIYVSLQLGRRTITDLVDAIPPGIRDEVISAVQKLPGVVAVQQVRIRRAGPDFFADVSLLVSRDTPFEVAHEIASQAEDAVHQVLLGSNDVVVNISPVASDGEEMITNVRLLAARHGLGAHGIRVYDVLGTQSLELHLEVEEGLKVEEAHQQASEFESELHRDLPDIERIVTHIEPAGDKTATRQARPVDETRLMQVLESLPEEVGIPCQPHDLVVNRVAGELSVSFHCIVDGELPITEAHSLTEKVESVLRAQVPNLGRVVIHVEPASPPANKTSVLKSNP